MYEGRYAHEIFEDVEVIVEVVEVMGVVEVIEVSLLFVEVTSLQKSKSLRVISDSLFNHWMSISKVLSQLVSESVSHWLG